MDNFALNRSLLITLLQISSLTPPTPPLLSSAHERLSPSAAALLSLHRAAVTWPCVTPLRVPCALPPRLSRRTARHSRASPCSRPRRGTAAAHRVPTTVSRKATRRRRPAGPRDDGAGEREREESSSVGGEGEASGASSWSGSGSEGWSRGIEESSSPRQGRSSERAGDRLACSAHYTNMPRARWGDVPDSLCSSSG